MMSRWPTSAAVHDGLVPSSARTFSMSAPVSASVQIRSGETFELQGGREWPTFCLHVQVTQRPYGHPQLINAAGLQPWSVSRCPLSAGASRHSPDVKNQFYEEKNPVVPSAVSMIVNGTI